MAISFGKLGYVGLLVAAILAGSVFHVLGSSDPMVFRACLTTGGTLIQVSVSSGASQCPSGTTPVTWNQQGPPGAAGGTTAIKEITSSTNFIVPPGVNSVMVEAWGGGGGGGAALQFPDCVSSSAGGGGGYLRTIIAVTPGESLVIGVGGGGAPGSAGGSTVVMRGSTTLVSAGGGAGASTTTGGAGGQVASTGGIVRTGNSGGNGSFDFMCAFGPGNPPSSPPGIPGASIQGTIIPLGSGAGGIGEQFFNVPPQSGQPGEVILTF